MKGSRKENLVLVVGGLSKDFTSERNEANRRGRGSDSRYKLASLSDVHSSKGGECNHSRKRVNVVSQSDVGLTTLIKFSTYLLREIVRIAASGSIPHMRELSGTSDFTCMKLNVSDSARRNRKVKEKNSYQHRRRGSRSSRQWVLHTRR